MALQEIVDKLDIALPNASFVQPGGSLLLMVGLPGTGKSSIVESLQALLPFVLISTDWVRAQICQCPTYTSAEIGVVYKVGYALIEKRLRRGERVVFDASNYLEARRKHVMNLAEACGAPVAVCLIQASQETIRQRLRQRTSGNRRQHDFSDADLSVYKWMVEVQEPVGGPHLILDTTSTLPEPLAKRLYKYWTDVEASAKGNPDLQPPRWAGKLVVNY